jgi:hypothetical protein
MTSLPERSESRLNDAVSLLHDIGPGWIHCRKLRVVEGALSENGKQQTLLASRIQPADIACEDCVTMQVPDSVSLVHVQSQGVSIAQ